MHHHSVSLYRSGIGINAVGQLVFASAVIECAVVPLRIIGVRINRRIVGCIPVGGIGPCACTSRWDFYVSKVTSRKIGTVDAVV